MSRRARAIAFALAALACATLAAVVAGGYRAEVASQYGALRPVVVAAAALPAKRPLRPADVRRTLEVRRVPARFVPPGTLAGIADAVGRAPTAPIPAGAYVLAEQLRAPGAAPRHDPPRIASGRQPVEITVTGAGALAAAGNPRGGAGVDVVVTTEPGPGQTGHTHVAAQGVELLALTESAQSGADGFTAGGADAWTATLALTRAEALRLIEAQNFAREVRLIPHP
jgi:Flp pilus assembly protein CpaB